LSIQLNRLERNIYRSPATFQRKFSTLISDEIRQLNTQIKEQSSFANYCVQSLIRIKEDNLGQEADIDIRHEFAYSYYFV